MPATEGNINEMQNKIWYVIKHENDGSASAITQGNEAYDIKINDIIKLGRVKYAVTEIKLNNNLLTIDKNVSNPVFNLIHDYE
jgi:hypothetical protein